MHFTLLGKRGYTMRISTKGRYGVRIMLELALCYEQHLMAVRSIAAKQELSEKYIEQIISLLSKGGLVRSQRGAAGGYRLATKPSDITVGQILRVTEGGLLIVECTSQPCERREDCVTVEIWTDIREAVENVVDSITLEDLVTRHNEKNQLTCMA